jgi:hypothetical protein
MPWVRFDDQFTIHRKVSGLSDAEFRLHVDAIFWCARNLTDGCIERKELDQVSRVRGLKRLVAGLVERELWHEPGQGCDSEDCPGPVDNAFTLHDYLSYQPSKHRVDAARKSTASRQQKWRDQHKEGSRNASSNAVTNAPVTVPRPVPTRKQQKDAPPASPVPPKGAKTERGARLPDDFTVTPDMADWARENAPSCGVADQEAFVDYWRGIPGAKGRKADWPATWRNWMRREHERRGGTRANGRTPAPRMATGDVRLAEIEALRSQMTGTEGVRLNVIQGELT